MAARKPGRPCTSGLLLQMTSVAVAAAVTESSASAGKLAAVLEGGGQEEFQAAKEGGQGSIPAAAAAMCTRILSSSFPGHPTHPFRLLGFRSAKMHGRSSRRPIDVWAAYQRVRKKIPPKSCSHISTTPGRNNRTLFLCNLLDSKNCVIILIGSSDNGRILH